MLFPPGTCRLAAVKKSAPPSLDKKLDAMAMLLAQV
jgi:hypothetical protein